MESVAILTTAANEVVTPIHDRMPVIIPKSAHEIWLEAKEGDVDAIQDLLRCYPSEEMKAWPVSTVVNSPANDVATCIEPIMAQEVGKSDAPDDLFGALR